MFAAGKGHRKCVDVLIEAGADVNGAGFRNTTALICAANCGRIDCIDQLIAAGADVNAMETNKSTAPFFAIFNGYYKCLDALIKAGADVNRINIRNDTPLIRALGDHRLPADAMVECVRCLLKTGANVNVEKIPGRNCQAKIARLKKLLSDPSSLQLVINLLLAAGEELDEEYPDTPEEIRLNHLCRETIRKHLLNLNQNENMFVRVPKLGLPAILTDYLLFNQKLQKFDGDNTNDDKGYNDDHDNDHGVYIFSSFETVLSHSIWT